MPRSDREREFDRIAASRMRATDGGFQRHIALGNQSCITFRFKLEKMGLLRGGKAAKLIEIVDSVAYQETLRNNTLGVRYATVKRKNKRNQIWGGSP